MPILQFGNARRQRQFLTRSNDSEISLPSWSLEIRNHKSLSYIKHFVFGPRPRLRVLIDFPLNFMGPV